MYYRYTDHLLTNILIITGLGAAAAIFFSATGSAIASAQGGIFVTRSSSSGIWSYAPIVIGGVLAIYGLIIGIIIQSEMNNVDLSIEQGYRLLCSGLVVGLGCLSSGFGMSRFLAMYMIDASGVAPTNSGNASVGDGAFTEASSLMGGNSVFVAKNNLPVTWGVIYTMVFLEAIGLYSLIVALFLSS